ncbi:MAG: FliA/WhiG family RNA polymerase sigma factor, partial [Ignavibacteriales bacterium]|nr:FliA/WhiG family RNA polymerase sigma factor [Ignavibacteriales bacterium]
MSTSELTLWKAYSASKSPELKHRLAACYSDLVRYVVSKIQAGKSSGTSVIEPADLEQVGYLGLLEAIERFDPAKGVKFETYALTRIRGSIQDELRNIDWVPRSVRKKVREAGKTVERLEQSIHETVSEDAQASSQLVSSEQYHRSLKERQPIKMELTDFSDGQFVHKENGVEVENNPLELLTTTELKEKLIALIETLEKRERLIVTLYYYEELTFKEIAAILRISESRVVQIHTNVLKRFRGELTDFL